MKISHTSLLLLGPFLFPPVNALAQEDGDAKRAELEAGFARLLTDSRLVGSFTADDAPAGQAPQEDSYTIKKAEKLEDGRWKITALVEFGGRSVPVGIAVDVEWAGTSPVIVVADRKLPLLGTYSARVLFDGKRYAGTWSGAKHGGHMFGYVVRAEASGADTPKTGANAAEVNWPQFRGTNARGIGAGSTTPTTWDVEKGENVRWKTPIAGLAHSSPVVWGDRIYLMTAVKQGEKAELKVGLYGDIFPVEDEGEHRFQVLCLDKRDGKVLWERTSHEGVPAVKRHPKGSHAASTPATNGEHVVAFFASEGLYCYDRDGELAWKKDFGLLDSAFFLFPGVQWGFASSPIIHEDMVIVQCDVQNESFLAALSLADGKELWRTPREEVATWSTPTVDAARNRVIVNGWKHMGGYELDSGLEVWMLEGGGDIPVPTPILAHDLIFLTNAHGRNAPLLAIDADSAEGVLSLSAEDSEHVEWALARRGNYMQTPIVVDDHLYTCSDNGILRCYVAKTGEELYSERLGEGLTGFTSSPVAADGKLYHASEEGDVHVIRLGPEFEVLSVNPLGETCMSTPAISEGVLLYRTRGHLVAIGAD